MISSLPNFHLKSLQGGELLICDKCPGAFCKRCIQRNLGRKELAQITSADEWACFLCNPKPIYKFRAEYFAMSQILKVRFDPRLVTPGRDCKT